MSRVYLNEPEVIAKYLETKSITDTAKFYNRDRGTIRRLLIRNGFNEFPKKGKETKFSPEVEQQIIDEFLMGIPTKVIGEKYGIWDVSVRRICHRHNISTAIFVLTDEKLQSLIVDYKSGMGSKGLAKKYHMSTGRILRVLKENSIDIKEQRTYPMNEHYFDNIDCEEKAYFLGFLYADGCNFVPRRATLVLQERDKELVQKLNDLVQPGKPLLYRKKEKNSHQDKYGVALDSKYVSEQLERLGVYKAKTFKIEFPEWLDRDLYHHFIRGYFDGDGCIYVDKKINGTFSLIGTEKFLKRVEEIFNDNLGITFHYFRDPRFSKENTNIHTAYKGGNVNISKIMKWLYKDATIYLQRKYDKFKEIENRPYKRKRPNTNEENIDLLAM